MTKKHIGTTPSGITVQADFLPCGYVIVEIDNYPIDKESSLYPREFIPREDTILLAELIAQVGKEAELHRAAQKAASAVVSIVHEAVREKVRDD